MPPIEYEDRYQTCVYWAINRPDAYGQMRVGSPVELTVRWVEKKRNVRDKEGNTVSIDVTVVLASDVTVDSIMRLGTLSDWLGTGSNDVDEGLMKVVTFDKTHDIKGREIRREATLMRFTDTLPT